MSDPQAILAAILALPDEDTPRLAYADWLDEHGAAADRDRAEFIRLQIEAARGISDARRRKVVETRCAELERTHRDQWLAPVGAACANPRVAPEFRRGFVGHIVGPIDDPRWVTAVLPLCPIESLSFRMHAASPFPDAAAWAVAADSPALHRVQRIDFASLPIPLAQAFFPSPHLSGLRSVRAGWVPAESMEAVARSPAAAGLRELRVSGGYSTAPPGSCFRALLAGEWPALEELRVDRFEVNDARVRELAAACARWKLRRLHVADHHEYLTAAGARAAVEVALTGAPGGIALGRLAVREEPVEPPPAAHELYLRGFYTDGDSLANWVRTTVPPGRFDRLAITGCRMNASGAVALLAWEGLAHLVELDLSNNWIGDLGAIHLAESPYLERVEALLVAHNDITKRGKDALKKRFGRRVRIS
jgi:uncharacterized protein (TIGR02996 family)